MQFKDSFPCRHIGERNEDPFFKATTNSGIEYPWDVGRAEHQNACYSRVRCVLDVKTGVVNVFMYRDNVLRASFVSKDVQK